MCLEGCNNKLGASIVLSGPDRGELKRVRHALKKCLRYARVLVLEKEYMRFIKPVPVDKTIDASFLSANMDFNSTILPTPDN